LHLTYRSSSARLMDQMFPDLLRAAEGALCTILGVPLEQTR
jgi:hypothetical protein